MSWHCCGDILSHDSGDTITSVHHSHTGYPLILVTSKTIFMTVENIYFTWWKETSRYNIIMCIKNTNQALSAFASLIWKSLNKVLPPNGILLENIAAVIRHTALPFIINFSGSGRGRWWSLQTCSTHFWTSDRDHSLGSSGSDSSSWALLFLPIWTRSSLANQGMLTWLKSVTVGELSVETILTSEVGLESWWDTS